MAPVRDENPMASSDLLVPGADQPDRPKPPAKSPSAASGFFTVYKRGQGKWTRIGTAFAAAALGLLTAYNLYEYALPYLPLDPVAAGRVQKLVLLGCVLFLVGFAILVFRVANRPKNADFLIATDSEMKKVNWTTKGELFGSTRVVVLFLVFIALFLYVVDIAFSAFFRLIHVLQ